MSLHVSISHTLGRITLDVSFDASSSAGLTALIGPSGAGKTSVLNAIAGLLRPTRGVISLDGEVFVDTGKGIFVPAHRRHVGYMFQEPRLFPHLDVRRNLLYGRRFAENTRISETDVIDLMGLAPLLSRHTERLSGGEKQRVALGRALLSGPRLLLLDEPLASVDLARKEEILPYLDRLRSELKLPTIYVTHNTDELMARADLTIALAHGKRETTAP